MKRLGVNLATTPFVNRALPAVALSTILGAALIFTIFNLVSFFILGREYRAQKAILKHQQERVQALQKDLAQKQSVLGSASVASFGEESAFVGGLLAQKRTSWLRFLADLERVKAFGVMLQSVQPQVDSSGAIRLNLRGTANPRAELMKFEQNLFGDPHFREVQLTGEQKDPKAPLTTFNITCVYVPEADDAP